MLPVRSSGEAQKLYGIAYSMFQLGKWSTQIQMGNSVEHLGAPQSFYEGPTVIADTEGFEKSSEITRILGFLKTLNSGQNCDRSWLMQRNEALTMSISIPASFIDR